MLIILTLYVVLVWLIFSKLKLVRWGWGSGTVAVLIGACFGTLSTGFALTVRKEETLIATLTFLQLPLSFLSSTFIQPGLMPDWMRTVSHFNPLEWGVEAARAAGIVSSGDRVVLTAGTAVNIPGCSGSSRCARGSRCGRRSATSARSSRAGSAPGVTSGCAPGAPHGRRRPACRSRRL